MAIKNPYKFVEKANDAFNLYLEKYAEIEKYMISSKKEQEELKNLIVSFINQYSNNQEKINSINNKFIELLEDIKEDSNNNELLNNLDESIGKLSEDNESLNTIVMDSINELDNNFKNHTTFLKNDIENTLNSNFEEINETILKNEEIINNESNKQLTKIQTLGELIDYGFKSNQDLINAESNKQITEIKNINDTINNDFKSNQDLINAESNKQITEIRNMNDTINNDFKDTVNLINNHNAELKNQVSDLLNNNYIKLNNNFKNSMKIVENHYENCRKYFFNGTEDQLKESTNTDLLFNFCYFNNIELLSYAPEENTLLLKTDDGIILSTNNHVFTIMEIYGLNEYMLPIFYKLEDFVVFDIGMNRAYATLKFASFNNCSAIYGFEIDKVTYDKAVENILLNPQLSNKIKTFNFGLSDVDEIVDLYYYDGYDGLNTMMPEFLESGSALNHYKDKVEVKKVKVKKASEIISNILSENNIQSKVVLKIDTEGAEYKIISDLISSGIIDKVDVIIGEGHIFSGNDFRQDLLNLGFKIVKFEMNDATYDFAFVREEYFNYWPIFQP